MRADRDSESRFKRVVTRRCYGLLNHGSRFKVPVDAGDFRLMDHSVVQALGAFAYAAYLSLSHLLYGHDVSGWTTIMVSLMLFAGVKLVSLGIVGEYVGRVYEEVKRRPLFLIKRELGQGIREDAWVRLQ